MHFNRADGSIHSQFWKSNIPVTVNPTRYIIPFETPNIDDLHHINFMIGACDTAAVQNIYFTEIKIEKGTVASSWSPNLQDLVVSLEITKVY